MGQLFKPGPWLFAVLTPVVSHTPGCVLHGSCFGVCSRLSPVQNPQGRVFGAAGPVPRGTVCGQVSVQGWGAPGGVSWLLPVLHVCNK